MANYSADYWIKKLHLQQHIEGGWYSEIYRSALVFNKTQLPAVFNGDRNACTHIYFLLEKKGFSAFHRIQSDELWHFYAGDPLIIYEIDKTGQLNQHLLGNDLEKGQSLFCIISAGNWFASKVADGGEYGLAGCTVAPGFDFKDFELAERKNLSDSYPQHDELIRQLS
ncbi:MAG: cupin domain-containing protein [Bacteroidota bacterium]|nr:cupin domain-containing protein [Bacteroidota bacterium]